MIDKINRQIIAALKSDGRSSCAFLAKKLGINAATVAKRIDKMILENVISIRAVLNPFKLGYNAHALITLDINLTKVDQICAQFVNSPNISLVVTTFGRFDVILLADFSTWEMLQDYITKELPKVEGINKIDAFPVIENKKIYNPLFKYDSSVTRPASIDEIDKTIIEELERNGRLNYAGLAHKLGISLATVSRRVARLKEEDILKIAAIRNPSVLGYLANAYIVLRADLNKVNAICTELEVYPEVHLLMTLMSGFEILAGIHLQSPELLYKFIVEKIANIDGVSNIETSICAEIKKRSYPLFELDNES
jgi:Lrp/AsnC family transcriptional regulator for asnA, asnC and gidA